MNTHHPLPRLMRSLWRDPLLVAFLVSGGLLLGAYGFEYIGGLTPCDLCWPQRYALMVVLGLSAAGLWCQRRRSPLWRPIAWAATLGFGASAAAAGYHAGVEQKWWQGPDTCTTSGQATATDMDSLLDSMIDTPLFLCDEIPWELFGISMAGYNFLISLSLFIGLIFALRAGAKG